MKIPHPMHPDEITPEWLTHALRSGGVLKKASAIKLNTEILGTGKGFMSSAVRVNIEYDEAEEDAPKSVVVKIEPESEKLQNIGYQQHVFEREIHFYKEVGINVPIRIPILYFSVDEPPAYSMVMEDLKSFTPGDQIIGMKENMIISTVQAMAKIQSKYWNNSLLDALEWMPIKNDIFEDYSEKWDSFVKYFGSFVDPQALKIGEKLRPYALWLDKEISKRPKTLVHANLKEDNLLFGDPDSDEAVLILDWQTTIRSMGAFDVAFLIGGSEVPAERKGHQFEVLRSWHDTLIEDGVENYRWEEAVRDLRLGALACLCFRVHFHTVYIGAEGRALEVAKVIFSRHFSSALEMDAELVLP